MTTCHFRDQPLQSLYERHGPVMRELGGMVWGHLISSLEFESHAQQKGMTKI